jgi:hypothetical protein
MKIENMARRKKNIKLLFVKFKLVQRERERIENSHQFCHLSSHQVGRYYEEKKIV